MTKWQAFAATKGIAPKPRRDRLVFDEEKQDWVPKWGYKGKNKELENQWIVEVPSNAGKSQCRSRQLGAELTSPASDPTFDPVANSKNERKERKAKNESQRLKNLQRAAANAAATTKSSTSAGSEREARKKMIERELKVTKMSTASMGKFDEKLEGEKKEKNVKRKVRLPSSRAAQLVYLC